MDVSVINKENHYPKIKTAPFSSLNLELFSYNLYVLLLLLNGGGRGYRGLTIVS